ncbi:uncharacterized protein OGAPODRAFT_15046 [Ogataea polymorpha]|uniref:uncharacterized protein n=1 Tax=Ogataea polymorpha TaxID=460523 RepID=UPI0007F3E685|nr:uncharacterized protein OGAPODRAFT_15046 [Ogataea polymorpha]KAG7930307.1 hypothetical protein KL934_005001 [Ogataea polymorpha]OBA18119.1 hypothetical protein OGAPODRAFT_15046 [Ogataea polymorpha]
MNALSVVFLLNLWLLTLAEYVNLQMVGSWDQTSFKMNVLETFSAHNESLYLPLALKLIGITHNEDEVELEDVALSDEDYFKYACSLVNTDDLGFLETDLALRTYSPRIVAHFQEDVLSQCDGAWLKQENNVYCMPDDVFALKTASEGHVEPLKAFDRVIGNSENVFILYGDYESEKFRHFFANLYESAISGKLGFAWRYTPREEIQKEVLAGYGIDLTLKRTDYIAIDDRGFTEEQQAKLKFEPGQETVVPVDDFIDRHMDDIPKWSQDHMKGLVGKLVSYIAEKGSDLRLFRKIMLDFPKYASYISLRPEPEKLALESPNVPAGIYINGAPATEKFLSVFEVLKRLKQEKLIVDNLSSVGVDKNEVRTLLYRFANESIVAAAHLPRYQTTDHPGIIYFNDLENDPQYADLQNARLAYKSEWSGRRIPPARENIHDLVFAINPTDPLQLQYSLMMINGILNNLISQRVGLVPLVKTEQDQVVTEQLIKIYRTSGPIEALRYLILVHEVINSPGVSFDTLRQVEISDKDELLRNLDSFKNQFALRSQPHVIINGIFIELNQNWQYAMSEQITADILYLNSEQRQGKIPKEVSLKDYLRQEALARRDPFLIPETLDRLHSSYVPAPTYETYQLLKKFGGDDKIVLNAVGKLSSRKFRNQVAEALKSGISLRIIDVSNSPETETLTQSLDDVDSALEILDGDFATEPIDNSAFSVVSECFGIDDFADDDDVYLILNGRLIDLHDREPVKAVDLQILFNREKSVRLNLLDEDTQHFEYKSWVVTSSFYNDDGDFLLSGLLPRYDFSQSSSFIEQGTGYVDVDVVIDPLSEQAQSILALSEVFEKFDFVRSRIWIKPSEKDELQIKRLYRGVFPTSVKFHEDGTEKRDYSAFFDDVPKKTLFTADVDVIPSWIVSIKEANTDLDNIKLDISGSVDGTYELRSILVQGHAREGIDAIAPLGLGLQLLGPNGASVSDTNVMANLGYFQLKANPGLWTLSTKKIIPDVEFEIDAVDTKYKTRISRRLPEKIPILDLTGATVYPIVSRKKPSNNLFSGLSKSLGSLFKPKQAEINIFTVASGHLYERFLGIMTASVMAHTKHTVKFWLIENYMSPKLKKHLPLLAKHYGFDYELVTYKWPTWLRGQREKQRTIWGYKILFLDVLFPQDLEKVIFVDSDQIVRTDMKELVDMDLKGAVYGFTPMCDSRKEMEGFRFWKQGYWKTLLGDNLKYHISALYVVDLKKFRQIAAGDRLRQHYQSLSADPNSLSNLDQDLPNNMQHTIPIYSLPQEWLWCETWCDDESLKKAKTIDLCNNPLTKEPKLDRARRQIPEWTKYDQEIESIIRGYPVTHDEL